MDNKAVDTDILMEESLEKILEFLEEKRYFQARDELDVYKRQVKLFHVLSLFSQYHKSQKL